MRGLLAATSNAYHCTGLNQFQQGQTYATGQTVKNINRAFTCTVGGWCMVGGPYEPGVGWAWTNAWTDLGACDGATSSSPASSVAVSSSRSSSSSRISSSISSIALSSRSRTSSSSQFSSSSRSSSSVSVANVDYSSLSSYFTKGRWYTITSHVELGATNQYNGVVTTWIDGVQVSRVSGLLLRTGSSVSIDKLLFETFFGGSTND